MASPAKSNTEDSSKKASESPSPRSLSWVSSLVLIIAALVSISYLFTETWDFNGQSAQIKKLYNKIQKQEKIFTSIQLRFYDGSNPQLPVYLAINGKVYDVTAGRDTYSNGGSYSFFSGRDAARAYVTGCFSTHLTHDIRGFGPQEMGSLKHWEDFFANSRKYFYVGNLIHEPIDPDSPLPPPC